jgi:hypothetical protein
MKTVLVNGTAYLDTDPVSWEDAEAEGGFYYSRARHLGLPQPPAILFDEVDDRNAVAMAIYHKKFREAEAAGPRDFANGVFDL